MYGMMENDMFLWGQAQDTGLGRTSKKAVM